MGDLISRSALLAELDKIEPAEDYEYEHDTWLDCRLEVIHAPDVDAVEVVRGRWYRYSDDKFMGYDAHGKLIYRKYYSYECSICGKETAIKSHYCPNCWAEMDGGEDDGNL